MTKNEQLAYAAGLFDGEGCCGVYADGAKHCAIRVNMVMCSPYGPQLFAELFGGHVYLRPTRRLRADGRPYLPVYSWIATADRAANALRELLPWLREKRAQAELVLEARSIQKRRQRGQGRAYDPVDLSRIADIRDRVKNLKRVG